jgi:uncharacterized membrane protein
VRQSGAEALTRLERRRRAAQEDPSIVLSARRIVTGLGAGVLAGAVVVAIGEVEMAPVVTWIVATAAILGWVWPILWSEDSAGTKQLAELESRTRTTDTGVLLAALMSLGAVVLAIMRSAAEQNAGAAISVILSVLSVVLSWALVNTVFALKYARLYYLDEDGGIDFKQPEPPAYLDFAYLAFTVGMTFAVSDTELTVTPLRRAALVHGVFSFFLATGIFAVAVNLVTNL